MKRRILRTLRFVDDLEEIAEFLHSQSPRLAVRFLEAVEVTLELLARFPGFGQPCPSDEPGFADLRCFGVNGFSKYLILFRPVPDGVELHRVLHGARDIGALLEPNEGPL